MFRMTMFRGAIKLKMLPAPRFYLCEEQDHIMVSCFHHVLQDKG